MAKQSLNGVLQQLRKVAAVQTYRELSDGDLLQRFVGERDEVAFTVLIERHGPMVLGVCRRALPNFHDAEDACQATFLVLARKAASVRKKTSLSSWLHGVACRVALSLKRDHARRQSRERGAAAPAPKDPAAEVSWREVQALLDEELQLLPERYRAPLILCYLECLTRDEAAQQLGLSSTTLHGRLERARDLLRERLSKRGLTLAAVMSAAALGETVAQAALAPTFVVSSTRAALLLAAGQPLTESVVAAHVRALTQEVLKTMFLTKVKLGTAAVLCAGLFAAMIGGSFTPLSIAQEAKPIPVPTALALDFSFPTRKTESDLEFIKRISKDLRGTDPTPTEIHFFVASKDAGRRQKLIDLFIQERQANKDKAMDTLTLRRAYARLATLQLKQPPAELGALQREFFKELHAAKEKGDVAKITQAYLDRLIDFVKTNPKSWDVPDAIRQIVLVYESQGKMVEAGAWRDKLLNSADGTLPLRFDLLEAAAMRDKVEKERRDLELKEAEKERIPPPPDLKGVIEKIDPKDATLLSISIGSDAGLTKDHTLEVYRLKPAPLYLGKIRIIEVSPRTAVARRVSNLPPDRPILQVGDNVTSSLTAPAEKKKQ